MFDCVFGVKFFFFFLFYSNIIHTDDVHHMRRYTYSMFVRSLARFKVCRSEYSRPSDRFLCVIVFVRVSEHECMYDLVPLSVPLRRRGGVCERECVCVFSYSFYLNSFYSVTKGRHAENTHKPRRFSQHSFHSRSTLSGIRLSRSLRFISISFAPILDPCGSHATVANVDVHFISFFCSYFSSFASSGVGSCIGSIRHSV